MSDTTLDSGTLEAQYIGTLKRVGRGLALALGTAATGYVAYRLIRNRRSPLRAAQKDVEHWLEERLDTLENDLHLPHEKEQWMRKQIGSTTRTVFRILGKAARVSNSVREMLHLIAEKKLLAMKLRVRNRIELKGDMEIDSLHKFYAEWWLQMFPSVQMTTRIGRT